MGNYNSESKSLCNLAFAQTQLHRLQKAIKSFSNALAKAHLAKNTYLQFQTCEGLGSTHNLMGRFGEAASYYQQALAILDRIGEDTGIARERVMEKLSEATEALQQAQARRGGREVSSKGEDPFTSKDFRESVLGEVEEQDRTPLSPKAKKPSITERRGIKALPPIRATEAEKLSERPPHKPIVPPSTSTKGKERLPRIDSESNHSECFSQPDTESDVDAAANTSQGSWSEELAAVRQMDKAIELHSATPTARSHSVRQGSLALGPYARDNFTVLTTEEWGMGKGGKRKRLKRSEIVPTSPSCVSTNSSRTTAPPQVETTAQQQSRVCTIL